MESEDSLQILSLVIFVLVFCILVYLYRRCCACDNTHDEENLLSSDGELDYRVENEVATRVQKRRTRRAPRNVHNVGTSGNQVDNRLPIVNILPNAKYTLHLQRRYGCDAVIAVDATSTGCGGFLLDFRDCICQTYIFTSETTPWEIENKSDSSEFEMKNLMFALMLYREKLIRNICNNTCTRAYKRPIVKVYTDNTAIKSKAHPNGMDAQCLLDHIQKCEGIVVANAENIYCAGRSDKLGNGNEFREFIKPADDLSRGLQINAEQKIQDTFNIHNFQRSYEVGFKSFCA